MMYASIPASRNYIMLTKCVRKYLAKYHLRQGSLEHHMFVVQMRLERAAHNARFEDPLA